MVTARPATSRTSSFATDIRSDYRGSPPLEDPAGVATPPEPDGWDQPDQRDGDIAHDAANRVECPVERGHQEVGSQDYPGETKAAGTGGGKDRAAEERGPQPVTNGRQHTTHQLGEDDRVQREDQLVPLHDEHALDELLDQPDFERADEAGPDQPVLEQGGAQHTHDAADEEGGDDPSWRKRRTGVMIQVPDDRRNGYQETAEKDDGGKQNDVVGDAGHGDGRSPEEKTAEEDRPPWRRPALRRFLRVDLHRCLARQSPGAGDSSNQRASPALIAMWASGPLRPRSEEHTSE